MQYNIAFTDLSDLPKSRTSSMTLVRNTFGAGQDINITIVDENNNYVDCDTIKTSAKIYIGLDSTLIVDGGTLTEIDATYGTFKYTISATDFDAESTDVGTWNVEVILANNATYGSQTIRLVAGGASLRIIDTIRD